METPSAFAATDPDDPKFVVTLWDDAATTPPEPPAGSRSMFMSDSRGRRFNCSIPARPSAPGSSLATLTQDGTTSAGASAEEAATSKSPFELLDALSGMCFYRKEGLWTYEMCYRKSVRQFRSDAVGSEQFTCGKYAGDEVQHEEIREDGSASGHPLIYVSHTFDSGAECVLTKRPRTAEVRFTCVREARDSNVLLSAREFPTCNYLLVLSTPFLCKHPAFKPAEEDLRVISCLPLDGGGASLAAPAGAAGAGAAGSAALSKAADDAATPATAANAADTGGRAGEDGQEAHRQHGHGDDAVDGKAEKDKRDEL